MYPNLKSFWIWNMGLIIVGIDWYNLTQKLFSTLLSKDSTYFFLLGQWEFCKDFRFATKNNSWEKQNTNKGKNENFQPIYRSGFSTGVPQNYPNFFGNFKNANVIKINEIKFNLLESPGISSLNWVQDFMVIQLTETKFDLFDLNKCAWSPEAIYYRLART